MAGKMTAHSPARQLLLKNFLSGEINGHKDLKAVWEKEDVFRQHKLHVFRTHYNRIRKEHATSEGK